MSFLFILHIHFFVFFFFFFNDTATTEIYTLSLHDALPILQVIEEEVRVPADQVVELAILVAGSEETDRKSTRLNSSHGYISYAVFCLKKKKKKKNKQIQKRHKQNNE